MLIREILTESRTDEAPVGMLTRGLTKLGAALGSNKLAGANDMQKMANNLYKDIEKWMGKSGIRQTDADSLLASPLFQGDQVMPDILQQLGADQGIIPAAKLKQAVLAYAKEYNKTGGTVAQQQSPAANAVTAPAADEKPEVAAKAKMAKDVDIINMDPMILRYRGKDFHLGDKGEWVDSKINRPAPQAFQAFLNQQADIADGAASSTPATPDPLDRIKANAGVTPTPAPAPTATKTRAPRKKKQANPAVNPAANSAI
jgi:hypothetical protein